ncbi:hypothetical protein LCGC14_1505040 [marine sediment metagenome]|uniref:Uncharacterized protein n=1 Tax=marine sediment metagenome TaxID=412755 RepID=A0A0F9J3E6_9ZZZZ
MFDYCTCDHEEERHATDAPEGKWACLDEDCKCLNFESTGGGWFDPEVMAEAK